MATHRAEKVSGEESEETQSRMSFGEHLDELRKRIFRALIIAVVGVALCMYFVHEIYNIVTRPYDVVAVAHGLPPVLQTLKPQEVFFTPISLAVKAGLVLTSPWIIFQLWQFIGAGLYKRERRIVYRYIGPSAILFLMGVAFFYFVVLPMTLAFFFNFSGQGGAKHLNPTWWDRTMMSLSPDLHLPAPATTTGTAPASQSAPMEIPSLAQDPARPPEGKVYLFFNATEHRLKVMRSDQTQIPMVVAEGAMFINSWRADDYLDFVGFTALIFGIAFQIPMIILILAQIDIVQTQTFRKVRKFAYFGILIVSVIVAPAGDPMSLAFLFIPLVVLYEVGIIAAAIATRGRPQEA